MDIDIYLFKNLSVWSAFLETYTCTYTKASRVGANVPVHTYCIDKSNGISLATPDMSPCTFNVWVCVHEISTMDTLGLTERSRDIIYIE